MFLFGAQSYTYLLSIFFTSVILSFLFNFFLIKLAFFFGWLDKPDGIIKNHSLPTPRLGGVGIFAATALTLLLFFPFNYSSFLLLISPFFLIGLMDDLFGLSVNFRLIAQIVLGIIFVSYFLTIFAGVIKFCFLLFLVVALINAFNMIDVSDGLSGSTAFSIFSCLAGWFILSGLLSSSVLPLVFAGSTLGFLFLNWPKAKIFLGDSGAWFLSVAMLFVLFSFNWTLLTPLGILVPIIVLGVPFAEAVGLCSIRKYLSLPVTAGSNHHFSMYLKKKGFSSGQVALISASSSVILFQVALGVFYGLIKFFPLLLLLSTAFGVWCWAIYGDLISRLKPYFSN